MMRWHKGVGLVATKSVSRGKGLTADIAETTRMTRPRIEIRQNVSPKRAREPIPFHISMLLTANVPVRTDRGQAAAQCFRSYDPRDIYPYDDRSASAHGQLTANTYVCSTPLGSQCATMPFPGDSANSAPPPSRSAESCSGTSRQVASAKSPDSRIRRRSPR
jgi:hypothetical protein